MVLAIPYGKALNSFFQLTLKALGFFLPMQHWGGVFSTLPPYVRLDPDIPESWNLQGR